MTLVLAEAAKNIKTAAENKDFHANILLTKIKP
jgi:hypothetical protein